MNIRAKIFGSQTPEEVSPLVQSKAPRGAKADMLDSVRVQREEARRANTRGNDRHRLPDEQVQVTHDGRTHHVQLVNLSGGGAMVDGLSKAKLWDRVDLRLGEDGVIECVVRWLKGERVGLEFAHETRIECAPDEQAELLRATIARSFPDLTFEAGQAAAPNNLPEPGEADGRRELRHPLIWSGEIHYDYQSTTVRLRNISSTGALIECPEPLRVGAEPLLDLGDAGQLFATVAWVVGDQAGLKFQSPFDMRLLSLHKPQVTAASWQPPSYLNAPSPVSSPWAEHWGRRSIGELREELEGFMKR